MSLFKTCWLNETDSIRRLAHGLSEIRNVIRAVFSRPFTVDWANVESPFVGAMIRQQPVLILMNPCSVLEHDPTTDGESLSGAFTGVALHEASHAVYTSPSWHKALTRQKRKQEAILKKPLSKEWVNVCGNLAEDGWIERRLTTEFPGFAPIFEQTVRYFYSEEACVNALSELERQLEAWRSDPYSFTGGAKIVGACYTLVLYLTRRTDVAEISLPPEVEAIKEATLLLRSSWSVNPNAKRLGIAVKAAVILDDLLKTWMTAEEMGKVIKDQETELREGGNPVGRKRVKSVLTRKQLANLRKVLENDAGENTLSASDIATYEVSLISGGEFLLEGKTVRWEESDPATLPSFELYDRNYQLTTLQERLLNEHKSEAESLRVRVRRLLQRADYRTTTSLKSGAIDEDLLPEASVGIRIIFLQERKMMQYLLNLVILVDESGSMQNMDEKGEGRWLHAARACLLLEYALRPLFGRKAVRLRVLGYTSDVEKEGETLLFRHFDSLGSHNNPQRLAWVYPKASNADGIALAAVRGEMLKTRSHTDRLALLMIGDGQPNAINYAGAEAQRHVQLERQLLERKRIRFTHLHIGDESEDTLNVMYGKHWQRLTQPSELSNVVAHLALRWLRS